MTDVSNQRRIASEILKCGEGRVWIDEAALADVSLALTRDDVRKLIDDGVVRHKQKIGISRGRARKAHEQKQKNQRRGMGRRTGAQQAREGITKKRAWINRIRTQRRFLRGLRENKLISRNDYRKYYLRAKGGQFRSLAYLRSQLQETGLIKAKSGAKSRTKKGGT